MKIAEIKNNTIYTWFYILLLAGYISISWLPYFLSVESFAITIPFRAFVIISSLGIIFYSYYLKTINKLLLTDYFFILFWIVYLVNIYLSFRNYSFNHEIISKQNEIYLRVIGASFLPSFVILIINPKYLNYQFILKIVYQVFFIILLLNVLIGIEYNSQGRSSGILSTYSIAFGHYGTTLTLLSLYFLLLKMKNTIFQTLLYSVGCILGIYIIYASGTRGPFIALIVALSYILYLKTNFKYVSGFIVFIILLILTIYFLNIQVESTSGNAFFSRLNSMIVSGNSSGRIELYKQALAIFNSNLFFGGSFLFYNGVYAHNFILDILMSMGILGLLIFVVFYKNSLYFVFKIKNSIHSNIETVWINIIFVQFVVFSFFSSSLFDASEFWYLTAMTMVLFKNNITK